MTPPPAPRTTGPVLLVVAGGAVSQAAIARTAELAAGAPVTVVGVGTTEISRTEAASSPPLNSTPAAGKTRPQGPSTLTCEPEQVRRTVALAMSVLESTGIVAVGQRCASGQILNRQHHDFLAGCAHEILGHQLLDDLGGKVGSRAGGERIDLRQGKCGHQNRHRMIATHDLSFGRRKQGNLRRVLRAVNTCL